jgi:hypothetical protein
VKHWQKKKRWLKEISGILHDYIQNNISPEVKTFMFFRTVALAKRETTHSADFAGCGKFEDINHRCSIVDTEF